MGPGAGVHGGQVVAEGTPADILKAKNSLTADYLNGTKFIPVPVDRRKGNGKTLTIKGARANNLKNVSVTIPLGTHFQFRAVGVEPLMIVGVTMPPWPGDGEAVVVPGTWEANTGARLPL